MVSILALPELIHKNSGNSKSLGTVGRGKLENAYLMPYFGENFSYFSPISYYLLDDAYLHSSVYKTLLDAYETCENTCNGVQFKIMECARKKGGKTLIHRTHQNGLSVDFMMPKRRKNRQARLYDHFGMWHYLLEFTDQGNLKIDRAVKIDFESMGEHILALHNAAQHHGLHIKKVILKIELKDDFFLTESGKKVRQKGVYFAQSLTKLVNKVHDDHYHIDFEIVK